MKKLMSKVKRSKDVGETNAGAGAGAGTGAGTGPGATGNVGAPMVPPQGDSPEDIVVQEVIAFCESAAPGSANAGEEYLHLPAIVDGAESSPTAAKAAAVTIRRYLAKDHYNRGFAQYNAIMLMRILTDNPGQHFTQNLDKEFVHTVKRLLRDSVDQGVQQILRETLDYFEVEKSPSNSTLSPLMEMWRKEKGLGAQLYQRSAAGPGVLDRRASRNSRGLPPPEELAGRIEEAKTTARLLLQTMQSTPTSELIHNDLVKEFASRARAAQKSIHNYMHAEDPAPDDDTMMTLIETNEQLNIAMSKHHRALLAARKQNGQVVSPPAQPDAHAYPASTTSYGTNNYLGSVTSYGQQPLLQQPQSNGFGQTGDASGFAAPPGPPPSQQQANNLSHQDAVDNPFTDAAEVEQEQEKEKQKSSFSLFGKSKKTTSATTAATTGQTYTPYSPDRDGNNPATNVEQAPPRPGGFGFGNSTPSYLNRQESAANNVTMHGASPPPQAQNN